MSSNNKENGEEGMRYRGHRNSKANASKSDFRNNNNNNDDDDQNSNQTNNNNNNINHHHMRGSPQTEEEMAKPLLSHDYSQDDESTNRGGAASSSSDSNNNNAADDKTSLMTTIAGIARKVRCKFLDKLPISFAAKFAVASPPDVRVAALRRFIDHHVDHVAGANAAEDGLTPRQKHHVDMIKALWERLNSRAPRCVRRRAGEEDEDVAQDKLTGKVWGAFGFQGKDPATDFRGAGQLALEHMLYFVTKHPRTLEAIAETPADHAPITAHYPFAVASINISMLLLDMLKTVAYAPTTTTPAGANGNSSSSNSSSSSNPSSPSPSAPASVKTTNSTTGNFHIGSFSAIEARRKLANFVTDPASAWHPPEPASSTVQNMNWTHKHFKKQLDTTMDDLFGPAVGEAQHKSQAELRKSVLSAEDRELEMIAERLAAVYVAACVMLHDQWLQSKRNVMYFNDVFKQTAARLELVFRDSTSFAQVMNAVWKDY